jgi:protein-L-isoaspartate(D-aspartate) O-methyltransferase
MPTVGGDPVLEALELAPGMRVLEVGAGTGYNAALLAAITAAPVVAMDANPHVVAEAREALGRLGLHGARSPWSTAMATTAGRPLGRTIGSS